MGREYQSPDMRKYNCFIVNECTKTYGMSYHSKSYNTKTPMPLSVRQEEAHRKNNEK